MGGPERYFARTRSLPLTRLYEVRDQSPTKPRVPIGERVQQIPQVVADGVQDGILSAKINYLNYQELTGELSPEEVLTQTQVFRSQMSDPDNLIDYGWGLEKLVETPANIAGQLIPAGVEGLRRAAVVGPGVGLSGGCRWRPGSRGGSCPSSGWSWPCFGDCGAHNKRSDGR